MDYLFLISGFLLSLLLGMIKARQSTVNGNNVRSTSFWISLASLLTSVAILIFN